MMLFDKDGIYYFDEDNNYKNDTLNTSIKLYNPIDALKRGNAFPNLYSPYKNYAPKEIKVYGIRERELLDIQALEFMINDLNLYLDLNSDDKYAYELFKEYVSACTRKNNDYSKKYYPLMLDDLTDNYVWSTTDFPWDEGGKNV